MGKKEVIDITPNNPTVIISHKWEYPLLECFKCNRQFVLLMVENNETVLPQTKFSRCPFCLTKEAS